MGADRLSMVVDFAAGRSSEKCQHMPHRATHQIRETDMAEYLILIYQPETNDEESTPEVWQEAMVAHTRFAEQIVELGAKMLGGNALQTTSTATSVRGDLVTDGPFAETKEALGGYYLIEADDLDQALAVAKLCPAPRGGVELRPILDVSGG